MTCRIGLNLEQRLEALRGELKAGAEQQDALHRRHQEVGNTMLRIAGAIQVLEEILADQATMAEQEP